MAYVIRPERPLDDEFRKVALKQIDKALESLRSPGDDHHEAVHDARKRFKKLRGLVRLIRPADEAIYKALNDRFRDAARGLSGVRDKAALIEALDALAERFADEIDPKALEPVRKALVAERDAVAGEVEQIDSAVKSAIEILETSRHKVQAFHFDGGSHDAGKAGRLAAKGLAKTYSRARAALKEAKKTREADDLHELRKRAKYHWMHLRLISPGWPEGFAPAIDLAKQVADDLGSDHDYAVLRAEIEQSPSDYGERNDLDILVALMDRYQVELRMRGLAAAARLLVDKEKAIEHRVATLYRLASEERKRDAAQPPEAPAAERLSA